MEHAAAPSGAGFVGDVARWSMWVAPVLALAGAFIVRDSRWAIACLVGAGYDIATLHYAAGLAPQSNQRWEMGARFAAVMLARFLGKALLIVAAMLLPSFVNTWGMVFGVLTTEITMMTVGAVITALRVTRSEPSAP